MIDSGFVCDHARNTFSYIYKMRKVFESASGHVVVYMLLRDADRRTHMFGSSEHKVAACTVDRINNNRLVHEHV